VNRDNALRRTGLRVPDPLFATTIAAGYQSSPTNPEVTATMPTPPPRPASDPWRDIEGTHIPLQSRVEQVVVDTEHGALASRLHQQGQVLGRGTNLVYVLFECDSQLIALRPHLLRLLDTPDGC
jgi:hypothetical protein